MKRLFDPSESTSSRTELPWHNSFNKDTHEIGNEYLVHQVIYCQTGLLLLTDSFKDFLYEGKKVTTQLKEAIEFFLENPGDSIPIVLEVSKERSAVIGTIEDYSGSGVWMKEGKGAIFKDSTKASTPEASSNPFLPTSYRTNALKKNGGTRKNSGAK